MVNDGKWMFIPLKWIIIGFDPSPCLMLWRFLRFSKATHADWIVRPLVILRARPPFAHIQLLQGFQVHWGAILTGVLTGISNMLQQSFQGIIKSPPLLNFIYIYLRLQKYVKFLLFQQEMLFWAESDNFCSRAILVILMFLILFNN